MKNRIENSQERNNESLHEKVIILFDTVCFKRREKSIFFSIRTHFPTFSKTLLDWRSKEWRKYRIPQTTKVANFSIFIVFIHFLMFLQHIIVFIILIFFSFL